MRRALAVLIPVLVLPAAGAAQGETLTLKAPAATAFGHRIDFAGRLSPSAPGTRIRLYNRDQFVAAVPLRGDGTYVLHVQVASPGPFHAAWRDVQSAPVTVKIQPQLQASFVGPGVVGSPLVLVAQLRPQQAGALRIRILRSGRQTLDSVFYNPARIGLGTQELGGFHIQIRTVARPGYLPLSRTLDVDLVPPRLAYGSVSPAVAQLTRQLGALRYAVPSASQTFAASLIDSVYAFEKVQGLERNGIVDSAFWARLANPRVPHARYAQPAAHIEIDKTHQVLYIVRNRQITLISPVSTAGIAGYYTPEGQFGIYRKVTGWDPSPLGLLYDPMYFTGGYAIHGNPSVPPYPASHGCIRVPMWVIPGLFVSEPYGETVYVYSS